MKNRSFATLHAIWALVLLLVLSAVHTAAAHTDVSASQAKDMIGTMPELLVIDVREGSSYCYGGHIPGAFNYPYWGGVFAARYTELPVDSDILVVCQSGGRSNMASNFLDSKGFTKVYDMVGGMYAWAWETVGCVDSDEDGINDDLDNCPGVPNPLQSDADSDGTGNICDLDCPDLDALDIVAFGDMAVLASNWSTEGRALEGDFNLDGRVDLEDIRIMAEYWLASCYQ